VLALALLHHLVVAGNLAFEAVRDMFCDLTERYLVLEFVPRQDLMFQRLTALRDESFDHVSLERFQEVFLRRFRILKQAPIPSSVRTLFFMEKLKGPLSDRLVGAKFTLPKEA